MAVAGGAALEQQLGEAKPVALPEPEEKVSRPGEHAHPRARIRGRRPLQGRPDVLVVVVELVHESRSSGGQPFLARNVCEPLEMAQMAFTRDVELAGLDQELEGVLADGLEQPVPRASSGALGDRDERLVHEAREDVERELRGDRPGGAGVEAADEHRQASERLPVDGIEQLVAPLHRGSDRPVVWGGEPIAPAERAKPRLQAREDLRRGHDADTGRSELDRQRQAIESRAQLGDRRVGFLAGHEIGLPLSRPFDEQAVRVRRSKRFQPPDRLSGDAERLAARGHDSYAAAGGE